MPKLNYSGAKGLYETTGSGFAVDGVSLLPGASDAVTLTGALTTITCVADVGDSLDGTYFILYDQAGNSYGFWFDVDDSGTTIPAGAAAATYNVEITAIATSDSASTVATKVTAAIDGDATAGAAFEAVASTNDVLVYNIQVGSMTDTTEDAGDSGFTIAVTDVTSDASIPAVPMAQKTITVSRDVATVVQEIPLADGSAAGQEKFLQVAALAAGQIRFTGKFLNSTTTGTKLTFDAATGAANGLYCVWTGTHWFVVNKMSTQTVSQFLANSYLIAVTFGWRLFFYFTLLLGKILL